MGEARRGLHRAHDGERRDGGEQGAVVDLQRAHAPGGGAERGVDRGGIGAVHAAQLDALHGHQRRVAQQQPAAGEQRQRERGGEQHDARRAPPRGSPRAARARRRDDAARSGPCAGAGGTRAGARASRQSRQAHGDRAGHGLPVRPRRAEPLPAQRQGKRTSPSVCTSGSSSTPKRSSTRRRPSAITASTSAVVAAPVFSMKLACLSAKRAPPTASPLQPASASSSPALRPSRAGIVGVLEGRAERPDPLRLGLVAQAAHLRERRLDGARHPRAPEQHAGTHHDLALAQVRAPVGESELRGPDSPHAARRGELDPLERTPQLASVGVRVHPHRAADRARDVRRRTRSPTARRGRPAAATAGRRAPPPQTIRGAVQLDLREAAVELERRARARPRRRRAGSSPSPRRRSAVRARAAQSSRRVSSASLPARAKNSPAPPVRTVVRRASGYSRRTPSGGSSRGAALIRATSRRAELIDVAGAHHHAHVAAGAAARAARARRRRSVGSQ